MQEFEINKVQMIIREFGDEVCDILGDAEACQRWLKDFHDGLLYRRAGRSAFADRLLAEAAEFGKMKRLAGQKGGFAKAARKKQKDLEVLVNPTLPGTACGDAAAVTNEGATAPAGKLLDNGHRLPAKTRADAHARKDWDASATVRAQNFDGDAATREGAEDNSTPQGGCSGLAPSPSNFQKRPGKSATSFVGKSSDQGGSERGAGGTAIDAVRRSPGAGKRPEPPTIEELYAFASDACLHEMLCREWWEMTYGDRAGLDRDGRSIRNWKAACRAYVKKRISNMENET